MIADNDSSENFLVVLDFDDTIVEGNSEESVKSLLKSRDIDLPLHMLNHYEKHKDWNFYINLLYQLLYDNNILHDDIVQSLNKISFVKGSAQMLETLRDMKTKRNIDVIVISGGNVLVIEKILENAGLRNTIDQILSNPVSVQPNGLVKIGLLNTHTCDHCFSGEMCKGVVIKNYLSRQKLERNIDYDKIFFAGDYLNDICLCLQLREKDFAMARHQYPLEKDLQNRKVKGQLRATLISWKTGYDVIKVLEKQTELI